MHNTLKTKSYVYAYYLADQIIYVGIGTHDSADYQSFSRAKQFTTHPEVFRIYGDQLDLIDVRILSENLTRKTALAVEGLLIRTLKPLGYMLNTRDGAESRLLASTLTKSGKVQRRDLNQATSRKKACARGGTNKRKYTPEVAKLVQKAQIALRQAKTEKTRQKWEVEIERLKNL